MYWIDELLALFHVSESWRRTIQLATSLVAVLLPVPIVIAFMRWSRPRQSVLPPYRERVLILGASSGVGRELALAYAGRGCRSLAIVGRRQKELDETAEQCRVAKRKGEEWEQSDEAPGWEQGAKPGSTGPSDGILVIRADCTDVDDVVRIREQCRKAFHGGLDTVHICFGVSALRPLLGISGVDPIRKMKRAELVPDLPAQSKGVEADRAGLLMTQEASRKIENVNVVATTVILAALLPMLQTSSQAPSIHLLSSASAYIPAPTRPLYGASKAAQLMVFQSTAIEAAAQAQHSVSPTAAASKAKVVQRAHVRFYASVPGTIKSDFRASAVDGSPDDVAAFDSSWDVKKGGKSDVLLPVDVAQRVILAVDQYKEGTEEMPSKYWAARRALPFAPSLLAKMARKKYHYN